MSMIGLCDASSSSSRATPWGNALISAGVSSVAFGRACSDSDAPGSGSTANLWRPSTTRPCSRGCYASKGVQPPQGDLYAIPGLDDHRDALKLGVNALLFDQHARRQRPKTEEPEQRLRSHCRGPHPEVRPREVRVVKICSLEVRAAEAWLSFASERSGRMLTFSSRRAFQ
jgi:hypothetical protein